ncbi:MAG: peptidylprolyl isomerase [Burkholderiales bacterium]|jgi:peptidyl-prolyl cis-trans isomerase SurA|nr:peptidylprolyl isomerase [Burkholderiales bacterium]
MSVFGKLLHTARVPMRAAVRAKASAGFTAAAFGAALALFAATPGVGHAQFGPRVQPGFGLPAQGGQGGQGAQQPPAPGAPFAKPVPTLPTPTQRAAPPPERSGFVDRIVAVVNNEVITQKELDDRIRLVTLQLQAQKVPPPPRDVLEKQVLERMIIDRAQLQFARETGVRVDDLTLDRTIARIAEQNRMSPGDFRRALERDGVSYAKFREDIRNELVLSRLREREVDSRIQVGDAEIDSFLEEQKASPTGNVEYNLRHVLVRVPEQATPEQLERFAARAREARRQILAGTDFGQVAASFSDAPDALQGGSLGWRQRDRLPELFADAVEKLKPGEVTPVLRSPAGFHVIRVDDVRGAAAAARQVDQTRVRHILARTSETVSEAEARRKLTLLRERIKGGADFAELARLNSDDGSASRGGDLGWIYPGDTVPEFERAMNELKIGDVSEPVRSPFGYHLIQVLERRKADIAADRQRMEARRILAERKLDESFQDWIRQLRDRTYVEYRLEER